MAEAPYLEDLDDEELYDDYLDGLEDIDEDVGDEDIDEELEALEAYLGENDDEAAERRGGRGHRRGSRRGGRQRGGWKTKQAPRTGSAQGLYRPPPSKQYVTQAQLQQGLRRVGGNIRRNGAAIRKVNTRVNALGRQLSSASKSLGRQIDAVAQVNKRQSSHIAGVKKDIDGIRQMTLFTALLGDGKKTLKIEGNPGTFAADTEFTVKETGDKLDKLLPVLMMGGLGGESKGGLMDNPLMLVLLMGALE